MLLTVSVLSVCCTLRTPVYRHHHTHTFDWCSPWKDWCTCRQVRHRQACPTSSHGGYVSCWKPQICYEMYRQICTVIECHKSVMKCTDRSALWHNATIMLWNVQTDLHCDKMPQICYEMHRQICTVIECHSNYKITAPERGEKQVLASCITATL